MLLALVGAAGAGIAVRFPRVASAEAGATPSLSSPAPAASPDANAPVILRTTGGASGGLSVPGAAPAALGAAGALESAGSSAAPAKRARGVTPAGWPVGPTPLPGAILPGNRIVAYYGNPYSKRMGILGEIPPDSMIARLKTTADMWAAADSTKGVKPALHLIVTVAQGYAGADGMHRLRMPAKLIDTVASWAEANQWLMFLDVQVGKSTVHSELPRLVPYLSRPYVHLALDPEFSMKDGSAPGRKIGTMDAADVNYAVDLLARVVDSLKLPPKVLVVHRFTQRMLTNCDRIKLDPRVQVVIDMDGFGDRPLKRSVYRDFVVKEPVQFTGFKLFYKNDKPMMTPEEVLTLSPNPVYVQYQ
ncbi:MAG TPA: hypothetical protein VFS33_06180 [Gemmatimonadales bacterium]|nr:hypothetical protein [Gemmatimonadales bacterium]